MTKFNGMSIKGALAILHPEGNTVEDVSKAWKIAMKKWHPDINASDDALEISQAINLSYETLRNNIGKWEVSWGPDDSECMGASELFTEMMAVYDAIKHLPNIEIKRRGIFVVAFGETKPVKDYFKRAGMRWNNYDKEWQWKPSWYKPNRYGKPWGKAKAGAVYGEEVLRSTPAMALG